VLFDITEVFKFRLSDIEAISWPARAVELLFRAALAIGVIDFGLALYRQTCGDRPFYGTLKECVFCCLELPEPDKYEVSRTGELKAHEPVEFPVQELLALNRDNL